MSHTYEGNLPASVSHREPASVLTLCNSNPGDAPAYAPVYAPATPAAADVSLMRANDGLPESPSPAFIVGDREMLYADFAPLVRRLVRQYGNDDAELKQDLAGEIYYRFCLLVDSYDPGRGVPLRPYLVRQLTASVYTYARQQWRSRKREVSLDSSLSTGGAGLLGHSGGRSSNGSRTPLASSASAETPAFAIAADPTPAWDEEIVKEKLLKCLPRLISGLPKRQTQVVIWRYYEQRSFEEIALLLRVKPATARSLLRHGLNNLRKALADGEIPDERG